MARDRFTLARRIVEMTREGRVQDWNERIADVARAAGVPLDQIPWQHSPSDVAHSVARYAEGTGVLDDLDRVVK